MQNKIQELTEKIYQEGISKGNAEAEVIVSNAKKEAEKIISDAKKQAEAILKDAKKRSDEIISNGEAELKLGSRQAITALKQQITDAINDRIIKQTVSTVFEDKEFMKKLIGQAIHNWTSTQGDNPAFSVLIPEKDQKNLIDFYTKSVKDQLNKGLEIKADKNIKSGFQISLKDGGYKISFTGEDFSNFFKQYLKPRLVELLFGD